MSVENSGKRHRNQDTCREHDGDGQQDELLEVGEALDGFLEILEFG